MTDRGQPVRISAGGRSLEGTLVVPADARAIVLFAHGSGSSRLSPRNRFVADALNRTGLATLLFDLLTGAEEVEEAKEVRRFDIGLLARRLVSATDWVAERPDSRGLRLGFFGASTGAAAALVAAAERPSLVGAVVSRGGRPDLAGEALGRVVMPTLLIVGGEDREVLELNRGAQRRLGGPSELVVVPGASHLFEEPGALEEVAVLAAAWFGRHLVPAQSGSPRERGCHASTPS
jgi:pimeloyl-ACP methyl ester carboxylesterase